MGRIHGGHGSGTINGRLGLGTVLGRGQMGRVDRSLGLGTALGPRLTGLLLGLGSGPAHRRHGTSWVHGRHGLMGRVHGRLRLRSVGVSGSLQWVR